MGVQPVIIHLYPLRYTNKLRTISMSRTRFEPAILIFRPLEFEIAYSIIYKIFVSFFLCITSYVTLNLVTKVNRLTTYPSQFVS
jgi:hypothetical protein